MQLLALLCLLPSIAFASSKPVSNSNTGFETIKPGRSQRLSFTGSSATSNAVASTTNIASLLATTACWVSFGPNPGTVAANDGVAFFVASGERIDMIGIEPGWKVSAIRDAVSGNLHVLEGAN